jgi:hypothetical protein
VMHIGEQPDIITTNLCMQGVEGDWRCMVVMHICFAHALTFAVVGQNPLWLNMAGDLPSPGTCLHRMARSSAVVLPFDNLVAAVCS